MLTFFPSLISNLTFLVDFELIFIALYLLLYRGRTYSNSLFAAFCISVLLNFTDGIFILQFRYEHYPQFAFIGNNFSLLFGPLLYLYARSMVTPQLKIKGLDFLHFLPFLGVLALSLASYQFQDRNAQLLILRQAQMLQQTPPSIKMMGLVVYAQFFTYAGYAFALIKHYERMNTGQYSALRQVDLKWLKSTIIFFSTILIAAFVRSYLTVSMNPALLPLALFILTLCVLAFIVRVVLTGLTRPAIFGKTENLTPSVHKPPIKYSNSTLSEDDKIRNKYSIERYMDEKKAFLEPELRLNDMAKQLGIKPVELSQTINQVFNQNFFDFVNRYRIEEACRLLQHSREEGKTIQEIFYQVGFNSKSSFNSLFKKYTGLTPSAFKSRYTNSAPPLLRKPT